MAASTTIDRQVSRTDGAEQRPGFLTAGSLIGPATVVVVIGLLRPIAILFRYSLIEFRPRVVIVEAFTA